MANVSTLGIKVDTSDVKKAAGDMTSFAKASDNAAGSATKVEKATEKVSKAKRATAASSSALERATIRASIAAEKMAALQHKLSTAVDKTAKEKARATVASAQLAVAQNQAAAASAKLNGSVAVASSSLFSFSNVMRALVLAKTVQGFTSMADSANLVSARLSLVAGEGERLARTEGDLFQMAQRTRQGYAETANLYGTVARASKALGASYANTLIVTESINKAMLVSGASAQASAAALMQLGQGLASGQLRGEELNSVLEQAPRLAQAISDHLGVNVGDLKKLAEEGKLTAEVVFAAMQSQAQKLNDEFAKMPATVGGAMTQVGNAISMIVRDIDRDIGATPFFARLLQDGAGLITRLNAASALARGGKMDDPRVKAGVQEEIRLREKELELLEKRSKKLTDPVMIKFGEDARQLLKEEIADRKFFLEEVFDKKSAIAQAEIDLDTRTQADIAAIQKEAAEKEKKQAEAQQKIRESNLTAEQRYQRELSAIKAAGFSATEEAEQIAALKARQSRRGSAGPTSRQLDNDADRGASARARAELEVQRSFIREEQQLLQDRLAMVDTFNGLEKISDADALTAKRVARDEYIAALRASVAAEVAILEAQRSSTKNSGRREEIDASIVSKHKELEAAIAGVNREMARDEHRSWVASAQEAKGVIEANLTPLERYNREMEKLNLLLSKGINNGGIDKANFDKQADKLSRAYQRALGEARKEVAGFIDYAQIAGNEINNFIGEGLGALAEGSYKDIGASFAKMIQKMMVQAAQAQLLKALWGDSGLGSGSNGLGDGLMSALAKGISGLLPGGARADGGDVRAGSRYKVGERGDELFTGSDGNKYLIPGQNGQITSNERLTQAALASNGSSNSGGTSVLAAPAVKIEVINQGKPAEVASQRQTQGADGSQLIEVILKEVASDIQSGGSVASAMQGTYNLSRAGSAS